MTEVYRLQTCRSTFDSINMLQIQEDPQDYLSDYIIKYK